MQQIMTAAQVADSLGRLADAIVDRNAGTDNLIVVGIHTRGYFLGLRLAQRLGVASGSLDIALYRDDLDLRGIAPVLKHTDLPDSLEGKHVVLVDDVLFTGRTIRAALDALSDIGRPKSIQLAVLIDRGHRELPIQADYVGQTVETARDQHVYVRISEHDGEDGVLLDRPGGD